MLDGLRDLSNEVAYLRNNCQQILDLLAELDSAGKDHTELTPYQHDFLRAGNRRHGSGTRTHLDIAAGYVADWIRDVQTCLRDCTGRGM